MEDRRTKRPFRVRNVNVRRNGQEHGKGSRILMTFEYEAMRKETQKTLTQFLDVELNLGGTIAQSALLSHGEGHWNIMDRLNTSQNEPSQRSSGSRVMLSMPEPEIKSGGD